jgi:hypothetical protein
VVSKKCETYLGIEIKRMWFLKCTVIPVIIGATGIVTKSLRKSLEAVPGKHSIDSLQQTAILGTSHTTRKVLQCETERWGSPLVQEKYQEVSLSQETTTMMMMMMMTMIMINNNNNICSQHCTNMTCQWKRA